MKAVLALDLDQTLIFSARSAGQLGSAATVWVEDYEGAPLSLMTVPAYELLAAISERHHVVPVTTRTPEQLARVRLPGSHSLAICSNGGVLLRDGVRDPEWDRRVAGELAGAAAARDVVDGVALVSDEAWVKTLRRVDDLFVYLVARDRDAIPAGWVTELAGWAEDLGWTVSVQGRKVYVVPQALSKGAAATRVAAELGGPLLAAGDSLLDESLLEAALYGARPAHGELHAIDYRPAGLHVSAWSGAAATADLLTYLAGRADALSPAPAG
jgi:hydroxymethylpyrimidine pyrophosphatase-like HAD family hydrolase